MSLLDVLCIARKLRSCGGEYADFDDCMSHHVDVDYHQRALEMRGSDRQAQSTDALAFRSSQLQSDQPLIDDFEKPFEIL